MADMDLPQIRISSIRCVVVRSTCMEAQAFGGREMFVSSSSVAIPNKCAVDLMLHCWLEPLRLMMKLVRVHRLYLPTADLWNHGHFAAHRYSTNRSQWWRQYFCCSSSGGTTENQFFEVATSSRIVHGYFLDSLHRELFDSDSD